ncbi:MAG: sigma-70 family RNA polymerase sigma factor, partial [Acidobacteria bacterium]|nr:sigma-70 family RNA polymerase sigma factor [Acidobacteriota bacterium]
SAPQEDSDLILRIKAGEKELFWQLAEPHYKSLYLMANTKLRNPDQAADAVQETMLKALIHIDQLNDVNNFRGWLMRIVINESRMLIRKRRTVVEDLAVEDLEDESQDAKEFFPRSYADWRNVPPDELERKEIWDAVHIALQTLSPICREVFVLRDIQQFSTSETATILDISEANVRLRLHRARLQMRELLAPLFRDACSPWKPLVMMMADMPSMLMHRVVRCKTAIRELSRYIDSQLDSRMREKIEKHLKYCRRCRILLDTTRKVIYLVADDKVFLPPFAASISDCKDFKE